ncbi:MAG: gliding motility-associated ABC transporter substrate-binding protein GldG [Flavobacteriaceae bacterium]|nr:gliding motility-associated ABC transporter substrate-binding protein GldG [Flavobacteriaceae bacterium]
MFALLKKEITSFFASPIGYLVLAIFLIINGLFLWLFKNEFNILDYGFADLTSFFTLAPWVLIFLIPAVTMRSFSEEKRQGTLELLLTRPISKLQIVLGKYFGAVVLIVLALIPTLLYVYTVYQLGNPTGNLDLASTIGSYIGLLFLVASYTAIGVFASSLSKNQIVAFIIAVFTCLFFYIGFESLADFIAIDDLGMQAHYESISRGIIDTRDLLYFITVTVIFILMTTLGISSEKINFKTVKPVLLIGFGMIVLNVFTQGIYKRFDLTKDKRYTLSKATLDIVNSAKEPIYIDVFLEGDFPSEFRRLQDETRQLLEEFSDENSNIQFGFLNPIEDESVRDQNLQLLNERGLTPMRLSVQENGKSSQEIIIPWALASYGETTVEIPLIKNKIGANQQELVTNSVQHLEYAFADGFSKLIHPKRRKIAVLRGNGQLENKNIADFVTALRDYYYIAPFTLDSIANNAETTLNNLKDYDLIISAKPTEPFTEEEKYVLDQYTMNGGKSLWLVDQVAIEIDSLFNEAESSLAIPRDLNLTDFFFKYGVRINPVLVNDMYSAPITLAIGEGSATQFQPIQWQYAPLASSTSNHPIVNNLNLVKFDFANQIDTLPNTVSKTILLKSSPLSKLEGTPKMVSLDDIKSEPNPEEYKNGFQNLAVLLEGNFTSVYNNRVKPVKIDNDKTESSQTKMIVIADGDVIKNEVGRNGPLELGFDRGTGQLYGNKEFLLNAMNYLLDDDGLINIRSKEIAIAFMDPQKISAEKTKWQIINIALPLALLGVFGFVFSYFRRKKYAYKP